MSHKQPEVVDASKKQLAPDTLTIHIRARHIEDVGPGEYAIQLDARPLSPQERDILLELFPDLIERAYTLLASQALIAAVKPGRS